MSSKPIPLAALLAMVLSSCLAEPAQRAYVVPAGEECPGNLGVAGRRYVPEAECLDDWVILCAPSSVREAHDCAQDADTGALYWTSYPVNFTLTEAWIPCERKDLETVMNTHRSCNE